MPLIKWASKRKDMFCEMRVTKQCCQASKRSLLIALASLDISVSLCSPLAHSKQRISNAIILTLTHMPLAGRGSESTPQKTSVRTIRSSFERTSLKKVFRNNVKSHKQPILGTNQQRRLRNRRSANGTRGKCRQIRDYPISTQFEQYELSNKVFYSTIRDLSTDTDQIDPRPLMTFGLGRSWRIGRSAIGN